MTREKITYANLKEGCTAPGIFGGEKSFSTTKQLGIEMECLDYKVLAIKHKGNRVLIPFGEIKAMISEGVIEEAPKLKAVKA